MHPVRHECDRIGDEAAADLGRGEHEVDDHRPEQRTVSEALGAVGVPVRAVAVGAVPVMGVVMRHWIGPRAAGRSATRAMSEGARGAPSRPLPSRAGTPPGSMRLGPGRAGAGVHHQRYGQVDGRGGGALHHLARDGDEGLDGALVGLEHQLVVDLQQHPRR